MPRQVKCYIAFAMEDTVRPPHRRTGRPLSFDRDAALEAAMHVFWRHGFEATSVAELTKAMGITPPSLYAAYGDKQALFMATIERYLGWLDAVTQTIAGATSARSAARDLLTAAARGDSRDDAPPGCLLASSIVSSSFGADPLRATLADIRRNIEAALRERIEQDIHDQILPPDTDADMIAGHIFAVVQGMSTLAKDGATRDKLLRIADGAMAGWPRQEWNRPR